eukprot:superscaffoldBa00002137_g13318
MQNIGNVSILGMFTMYFFTAIFGYLTFYGNTEAELLHTYSKVDPLDTLILCVRLAVLVAVTLTVPVVLFPIRRALLQLLFPGKPFHWLRHIAIALCLLFAVNLLVILVPNIRDIFGITGATTAPSLIFILPGLFYIRIIPTSREPLKSRPKIQLKEEEAARDRLVAKGIRKHLQMYMFPALTHLLTDTLAVVNRMNLMFQTEDVNISSIQPVVTLACLENMFCGITLTQADAQTFSILYTEYTAEATKSIKKRFPSQHLGIIADLDTVLNTSRYLGTDSALKSYGLDALEHICDHCRSQRGALAPLLQRERMLQDLKTLAEVALVIPVSSNDSLLTIASAAISLDAFDYAQASTQFKPMWTRRKG